jgi:hypothetical protein
VNEKNENQTLKELINGYALLGEIAEDEGLDTSLFDTLHTLYYSIYLKRLGQGEILIES